MSDTNLKHLGIVLDGNRRWARAKGVPVLEGHRQGMEIFKEISLAAFDSGVEVVSAYIFSTENWKRTQEEVSYLMTLVVKAAERHLQTFHAANIRIVHVGSREGLSSKVLNTIDKCIEQTKDNKKGTLALCFNYGGHQEIVDAVRAIVAQGIAQKNINGELIEQNLYSSDLPPLDLLIRTSGEQRTSGFMLWRADYAELKFTDTLWPDFSTEELESIISEYKKRNRRLGK